MRSLSSIFHLLVTTTKNVKRYHHTLPRLYIENVQLTKGHPVELTPDQSHYLSTVLRRKGKQFRGFNAHSGEWLCDIMDNNGATNIRKSKTMTNVIASCDTQLRPPLNENDSPELFSPTIVFAQIKKPRAKLLIEKCTELGASNFALVQTEFTNEKSSNIDKLQLQAIEAAEQSERLSVPSCLVAPNNEDVWKMEDALDYFSSEGRTLLICRERERGDHIITLLSKFPSIIGTKTSFLIGPEGGWSPKEEAMFDECSKASNSIRSISLGKMVLRAETCAIAATTAWAFLQQQDNDML